MRKLVIKFIIIDIVQKLTNVFAVEIKQIIAHCICIQILI